MDVLNTFLKAVHGGFDVQNNIEPNMWEELVRLLNEAAVQGLSQGDFAIEHNKEFLRALKHSNEVFAAFKTHVMGISMADKLLDENGNLKPFDKWVKDVSSISRHQVVSWLKTEYNTAVLRAHNAADWQEFVANKDILPNLRWMPTTSPDAEATHRAYWEKKLTLPVDHPFWVKHHPGDRWNCKCALEATDEPATPEGVLDKIPDTKPHRGLENNPGMDGVLIGDSHPYFPTNCRQCAFYKNKGLKNKWQGLFFNQEKDCNNCEELAINLRLTSLISHLQDKNFKPSVEDKEFIYSLPEKKQFMVEYASSKGTVLRHILASKYEDDYKRVEKCAIDFAQMFGEARINPRIPHIATRGREVVYKELAHTTRACPDLLVKDLGWVDVKSPQKVNNCCKNANDASSGQKAYVCITDDCFSTDITEQQVQNIMKSIAKSELYTHDTVFWRIKGKLLKYKKSDYKI